MATLPEHLSAVAEALASSATAYTLAFVRRTRVIAVDTVGKPVLADMREWLKPRWKRLTWMAPVAMGTGLAAGLVVGLLCGLSLGLTFGLGVTAILVALFVLPKD